MMNCKALDPLVTPYIDGEIGDDDRRAIDEHLRHCPPCYSRVCAERVVHDFVRARAGSLDTPRAPETLRRACSDAARLATGDSRLRADDSRLATDDRRLTSARPWRIRLAPFALAASLVVIVAGAFVYQATDRSDRVMAAELAADHLRCFAMNAMLGTHQSALAVESSMASGFGWRTHLPEDRTEQLELVGARPCFYGKGRVAHVMYRHQGHPVSLFMLPDTERARDFVEVLGHEAAIWCVGNRTFVLVAREPKPEVERLASFVQAGLR